MNFRELRAIPESLIAVGYTRSADEVLAARGAKLDDRGRQRARLVKNAARLRNAPMNDSMPIATPGKISTGIEGFDDLTHGGLPLGATTLLMGGPGCGKTVLALQSLVSAAQIHRLPGIFVAFEEDAARVAGSGTTFGWPMAELEKKEVHFVNASLRADVVKSGAFDLVGLLAGLEAKARAMGAKLIVFDAIDVLLSLLDDPAAECHELYRIHEWLQLHRFTGILTAKTDASQPATAPRYGFMPFMADCVVQLSQQVTDRVTMRTVRVIKYRGSSHVLNEVPFVISSTGIEVGSTNGVHPAPQPFEERVSLGIERLDEMLSGGLYAGTNALLSGSSGAGKSTMAGAFLEAACRRKERALFISFDENSADIVRDLATMKIALAPHLASGELRMEAIRTESASCEEHFLQIKRFIALHQPRCVAIDPISALVRVGGTLAARIVVERLIYLCRNAGITVLFTSFLEGHDPHLETTSMHISTIADTWIQLTYELQDGERNRALSVIKSRGSKHSNQLRELLFSENGVTLAEPFAASGRILLGTMRSEKERAEYLETDRQRHEIGQKRRALEQTISENDQHTKTAERELQNRSEELETLSLAEQILSDGRAQRAHLSAHPFFQGTPAAPAHE